MRLESGRGSNGAGDSEESGSTASCAGDLDTRLVDEVDVAVIAVDPGGRRAALEPSRRADLRLARRGGGRATPCRSSRSRRRMRASPSRSCARCRAAARGPATSRSGTGTGRAHRARADRPLLRRGGRADRDGGLLHRRDRGAPHRGGAPAQRGGARIPRARERDPRLVARAARHAAAARRAGGAVHRRRLHGGRAPRGRHDRALRAGGGGRRAARRVRAPAPAPDRSRGRASDRARDAIRRAAAARADRPRGPHAVGGHPGAPGGPAALPRPARNGGSDPRRATGCSGRSPSRCPSAGRTSARRTWRSSRSWRAALRPRSRTRASTPSARTSRETLQRSLLPASLPSVDGFELAAIYRPAAGGTEVGGDFYDVFETCGGGWGVAIARRLRQGRRGRHRHRARAVHPARRRAAQCRAGGDARDGQRRAAEQLPRQPVLHRRARRGRGQRVVRAPRR